MTPPKNSSPIPRAILRRKGVFSTVMALAILLAIALVLLYVMRLYSQNLDKEGNIQACRLSILLASNTKNPVTGTQMTDLNCKRRSLTISKDAAYRAGQYSDDKLKRSLSEEMRTCWYMLGAGSRPFGNSNIVGSANHCIICTEITFEPDLVNAMRKLQNLPPTSTPVLEGFSTFFQETSMGVGKYGNPDLTYSHYINDPKADTAGLKALAWMQPVPTAWYTYSPAEPDSLPTKVPFENLAIMEVYKRRGTFTEDYYTLDLVPASKVSELSCDKLWN